MDRRARSGASPKNPVITGSNSTGQSGSSAACPRLSHVHGRDVTDLECGLLDLVRALVLRGGIVVDDISMALPVDASSSKVKQSSILRMATRRGHARVVTKPKLGAHGVHDPQKRLPITAKADSSPVKCSESYQLFTAYSLPPA